MKRKTRKLIALLLLTAGILAVLSRVLQPAPGGETPRAERWIGGVAATETRLEPPPTVQRVSARQASQPELIVPGPLPQWAAQQGKPGEFWVRVNSAEEAGLLRRHALENNLRILSSIDALAAFRLAGRPADWSELPLQEWQGGANTVVFLPALPEEDRLRASALSGVGDGLAGAVGVTQVEAHWGEGVLVALLDTGIPADEATGLRILQQLDMVGDGGGFLPHALAVAHLLAGEGDLASGLARSIDLLDVRVLNSEGRGDAFTLAAGIVAAVDAGAHIINTSLGGYQNSDILAAAVRYAHQHGVLVVAAAGNDGSGRPLFPAAFPEVVAVAAHDANRQTAPFSNHGQHIDLSAPGVGLYTRWQQNQWVVFDGTSAAAPIVAGAAAALMSLEPHLSHSDVRRILLQYSADAGSPGPDPFYGVGTLDLGRILHRQQAGWFDVAIADVFVNTEGAQPSLQLSIQNLGTEMAIDSTVEVRVNDRAFMPLNIAAMRPGEITIVTVPVDITQPPVEGLWHIEASVHLPSHVEDQREANNRIRSIVRPAP